MPRARKVDPTLTEADKQAIRNNRVAKRNGKLSSHAVATDESRTERLARAQAVMAAAMAGTEKSLVSQAKARRESERRILGKAFDITDEQLVEVLFENLPISTEQAIERLARVDIAALRKMHKSK